jgi:hypothetical protein
MISFKLNPILAGCDRRHKRAQLGPGEGCHSAQAVHASRSATSSPTCCASALQRLPRLALARWGQVCAHARHRKKAHDAAAAAVRHDREPLGTGAAPPAACQRPGLRGAVQAKGKPSPSLQHPLRLCSLEKARWFSPFWTIHPSNFPGIDCSLLRV